MLFQIRLCLVYVFMIIFILNWQCFARYVILDYVLYSFLKCSLFQKNRHHSTFALDIHVKVKKINTKQQYYVTLRFNRWFVKMDCFWWVGALKWMKITRDKHKPGNILNSRVWFHKKTITKWHEIYCNKGKIRFVSCLRLYRYIMVMRMLILLKKRYSSYLSAQPQMANAKNAYVPSSPVKSEYHCSKSLKCVNGTHTLVRYEKLWKSHA